MTSATALGQAIRLLREQHGLTQLVLAHRADLDPKVITHLERGLTGTTLSTLESIAAALHEPTWSLLRFAARLRDTHDTRHQDAPDLLPEHWTAA